MPDSSPPAPDRSGTLICDLAPLGVLRAEGADATAFLQGQLSNDVRRVAANRWQRTTYNSPKGRMLADLVLWQDGPGYLALLPAEILEPVRRRLAMFVLRAKVALADAGDAFLRRGVAGPEAGEVIRAWLGEVPGPGAVVVAASGQVLGFAPDRFVALVPAGQEGAFDAAAAGARRGSFAIWQGLMIRSGIPTVTAATQDLFVPQTANMDALGAISFDKGCYTGQEIVARTQYLGRLKERLSVWHAEVPDVTAGTRLYSTVFGDQACGTVVNAAPSEQGGTDLLAVVQVAAADAGDLRLGAPDGTVLAPRPLPYALPAATAPRRPA